MNESGRAFGECRNRHGPHGRGSTDREVLDFKDRTAGKKGPIAWQMHNKGLFDEYKDVRIEVNPKEDKLTTVE